MEIEQFLKQNIKEYLFGDIENMLNIDTKGNNYGACGYPIIISILSGMELLGALSDEKPFNKNDNGEYQNKGSIYFENYWNIYFSENNDIYGIENITKLIRKLIRNGLAHNFTTKQGIFIVINKKEYHWKIDKSDNFLSISCRDFYDDFKDSYHNFFIKEMEKNKERMQTRLNEIIEMYLIESKKYFNKINISQMPEGIKKIIDIDRTFGSPAVKLRDVFITEVSASGTPMSATPSQDIVPSGLKMPYSGNFPIFPKKYFPDIRENADKI